MPWGGRRPESPGSPSSETGDLGQSLPEKRQEAPVAVFVVRIHPLLFTLFCMACSMRDEKGVGK